MWNGIFKLSVAYLGPLPTFTSQIEGLTPGPPYLPLGRGSDLGAPFESKLAPQIAILIKI